MSRIASVKETGEDISEADWKRFEQAVGVDGARPSDDATRAVPADESGGSDERETANPRPTQA